MKKILLRIALTLLTCLTAPALANGQSMIDEGLYISGHGLIQKLSGTNETASGNDHHEFDPGWGATAAIGYVWAFPEASTDVRVEIEGSYRVSAYDSITFANGDYWLVDGDVESLSGMVNVIVDFRLGERFVPHLGAGLGRAKLKWKDLAVTVAPGSVVYYGDSEEEVTMTQAMFGLGYRLSPGLIIDAEYRLFNPNDPSYNGLMGNEYTIGFRMIL